MEFIEKKQMGRLGRIGIPEILRRCFELKDGCDVTIFRDRNRIVLMNSEEANKEMGCPLCSVNIPEVRINVGVAICRPCAEACAAGVKAINSDTLNLKL